MPTTIKISEVTNYYPTGDQASAVRAAMRDGWSVTIDCEHLFHPADINLDEADDLELDFAMLTPPTRPGPRRAATAPEVDPVEARLEREVQAAQHIAAAIKAREDLRRAYRAKLLSRPVGIETDAMRRGREMHEAIEVRHGSGKVKV